MARLAEYLARLATVFGFQEHVHFLKVRKGSAIPEIHVSEATATVQCTGRRAAKIDGRNEYSVQSTESIVSAACADVSGCYYG